MARIPIANKHDNTATNQHLVPRCYMKEWSYNPKGTSVWLYEKGCDISETDVEQLNVVCNSKPIKKINSIDNYYDIKAGCYFMPQEALNEIFGPTMHLKVVCNGEQLDTEKKRNNKFGLFDEWIITDEFGTDLTQDEIESLRIYFTEARFVFIEEEWGRQYENNWRTYIKNLENDIRQTKAGVGCKDKNGKNISGLITSETIKEIVKMLIIFDIRGFSSDEYLNKTIDEVIDLFPPEIFNMQLDECDRMHPIETTVRECFRHQFLLRICYDILKDNQMTGLAKVFWDSYTKNLVPRFCLTDISHPFVTSERPAFMNTIQTGEKEHIFVALPTMLISMGKGENGQFYICNLSSDEVDEYNKAIICNNEHIISNTNQLDVEKIFINT